MAYLSFAPDDSASLALPAERTAEPVASLSALEWSVISLARGDRLSSLRRPTLLGRIAGILFGGRFDPRLPDPRLEALRTLAVIVWHRGYDVATREEASFLAAGYSSAHFTLVVTSITRSRQAERNRLGRHGQQQPGTLA